MGRVTISKPFRDRDGVCVFAQQFEGELVRRGYSEDHHNWFWNIIADGRVVAVTLGHPPHTEVVQHG